MRKYRRRMEIPSRWSEHTANGFGEAAPARSLELEVPPAVCSQTVVLRSLIVLGHLPLGVDESLLLQPVHRRVERAVIDVQRILRARTDRDPDAVAVLRT